MRLSVWIPDELAATIKEHMADVNVSKVLQDGLRGLLKCSHSKVVCAECSVEIDQAEITDSALSNFYRQLMWELFDLVHAGGTCEGAAKVAKGVAEAHHVSAAAKVSLPRPPRGVRERREWDREWLERQGRLAM